MTSLRLGDIAVDVVLKDIKNVHLSVYPPTGRVRISAPKRMSVDTIRVYAVSKLDWIKQQQMRLREQERDRVHQVRAEVLEQETALAERFPHQAEVSLLQVAQPAVNQLARAT